jgi:hypothetical protein
MLIAQLQTTLDQITIMFGIVENLPVDLLLHRDVEKVDKQ